MKRLTCVLAVGMLAMGALGQSKKPGVTRKTATAQAKGNERRAGGTPLEPNRRARPRSTRRLLNMRVEQIALDDVPLEQVTDWLAKYTGVNVVVHWDALESVGVERNQPISLKMRNIRLSQVLWLIMQEATGGGPARLAYRATGNMIVLSTHADLNRGMIVRVYDVRDLLMRVPFHANARFVREQTFVLSVQPRVAPGAVAFQPIIGRAVSGVELYTDDDEGDRFEDEQQGDRAAAVLELIDTIVTAVEPETWSVNGGGGAIREFNGFLIVRNTPFVHQQLAGPARESNTRP